MKESKNKRLSRRKVLQSTGIALGVASSVGKVSASRSPKTAFTEANVLYNIENPLDSSYSLVRSPICSSRGYEIREPDGEIRNKEFPRDTGEMEVLKRFPSVVNFNGVQSANKVTLGGQPTKRVVSSLTSDGVPATEADLARSTMVPEFELKQDQGAVQVSTEEASRAAEPGQTIRLSLSPRILTAKFERPTDELAPLKSGMEEWERSIIVDTEEAKVEVTPELQLRNFGELKIKN